MITIRLKSGSWISLRCDADPVDLIGAERDLVLGIADKLREYAAEHPDTSSVTVNTLDTGQRFCERIDVENGKAAIAASERRCEQLTAQDLTPSFQ